MKRHAARGFTLVEFMIAVSILGILTALAIGSWIQLTRRSAGRNAALDFASALFDARARAVQSGVDVWVVVFPTINRDNYTATPPGGGAYFVIIDPNMDFGAKIRDYHPDPGHSSNRPAPPAVLVSRTYLDSYSRSTGFLKEATSIAFPKPFGGLTEQACSFCSDGSPAVKGAIVFSSDGTARFVDSDGNPAAGASHVLVLETALSGNKPEKYLFAIAGPTGFIGRWTR